MIIHVPLLAMHRRLRLDSIMYVTVDTKPSPIGSRRAAPLTLETRLFIIVSQWIQWTKPAGHESVLLLALAVLLLTASGCTIEQVVYDIGKAHRYKKVAAMTDQPKLAAIVLSSNENSDLRELAVENLTDQALLAKVFEDYTRYASLMTFDSENIHKILSKVIARLTNQTLLARVMLSTNSGLVYCDAAVGKLTDQSALAEVALGATHPSVRRTATSKLTDQALLARISKEDSSDGVRLQAVASMTDRTTLTRMVDGRYWPLYDERSTVAVLRLFMTDPRVDGRLGKMQVTIITKEEQGMYGWGGGFVPPEKGEWMQRTTGIRVTITGTNSETLVSAAWSERMVDILNNVADVRIDLDKLLPGLLCGFPQTELARIAGGDHEWVPAEKNVGDQWNPCIRRAAFEGLADQTLLAKLATENKSPYVRSCTVRQLKDRTLLAKIAVEDYVERVRNAAAERIRDLK